MYSIEELKTKVEKMQAYIETPIDADDYLAVMDRIVKLNVLIAQSGKMVADAGYYKDQITNGTIMEAIQNFYYDKLTASNLNLFIKSAAKDQNHLVSLCEQVNKHGAEQLRSAISILSFIKSQLLIT